LYAGEERFEVQLFVDHGQRVITSVPVLLQVAAQPRPHLGYQWKVTDENNDGILQAGENATVNLTVMNDGQGASEKLTVRVFKDNDPFVQLDGKGGSLSALAAGAEESVNVPLRILPETQEGGKLKKFSAAQVKLQVRIDERFDENVDARFRATLFHELTIPVGVALNPKPIIQPKVQLIDTVKGEQNKVTLTLKVDDDNLRFVTTFLNEDKIDLLAADKLPADKLYRVSMTLKPGANAIRVAALDYDRLDEVMPIRLWGDESTVEKTPSTAPTTTTLAAPVSPAPAPFIP
jgi:CARDB